MRKQTYGFFLLLCILNCAFLFDLSAIAVQRRRRAPAKPISRVTQPPKPMIPIPIQPTPPPEEEETKKIEAEIMEATVKAEIEEAGKVEEERAITAEIEAKATAEEEVTAEVEEVVEEEAIPVLPPHPEETLLPGATPEEIEEIKKVMAQPLPEPTRFARAKKFIEPIEQLTLLLIKCKPSQLEPLKKELNDYLTQAAEKVTDQTPKRESSMRTLLFVAKEKRIIEKEEKFVKEATPQEISELQSIARKDLPSTKFYARATNYIEPVQRATILLYKLSDTQLIQMAPYLQRFFTDARTKVTEKRRPAFTDFEYLVQVKIPNAPGTPEAQLGTQPRATIIPTLASIMIAPSQAEMDEFATLITQQLPTTGLFTKATKYTEPVQKITLILSKMDNQQLQQFQPQISTFLQDAQNPKKINDKRRRSLSILLHVAGMLNLVRTEPPAGLTAQEMDQLQKILLEPLPGTGRFVRAQKYFTPVEQVIEFIVKTTAQQFMFVQKNLLSFIGNAQMNVTPKRQPALDALLAVFRAKFKWSQSQQQYQPQQLQQPYQQRYQQQVQQPFSQQPQQYQQQPYQQKYQPQQYQPRTQQYQSQTQWQ